MKKIIIVLTSLVLLGSQAFAQLIPGGGYLNTTITSGNESSSQNGFYAGASINMGLSGMKGLTFVPGAYLSLVESSSSADFAGLLSGEKRLTELVLNVPAYFAYTYGLSGGAKVFAFAGPSAQLGLFARRHTTTSGLFTDSTDTDLYTDSNGLNRLNIFVGGGIGFGISRFIVNVGYDYGLMDVYRSDKKSGNRANLHFGIGYEF